MNALWVVVGLSITGAVAALIASWRQGGHGDGAADLGSVSHQWIAEHRQDSRR